MPFDNIRKGIFVGQTGKPVTEVTASEALRKLVVAGVVQKEGKKPDATYTSVLEDAEIIEYLSKELSELTVHSTPREVKEVVRRVMQHFGIISDRVSITDLLEEYEGLFSLVLPRNKLSRLIDLLEEYIPIHRRQMPKLAGIMQTLSGMESLNASGARFEERINLLIENIHVSLTNIFQKGQDASTDNAQLIQEALIGAFDALNIVDPLLAEAPARRKVPIHDLSDTEKRVFRLRFVHLQQQVDKCA